LEPSRAEYTIPLDPKMWDSPYANQSAWWFYIYLTNEEANSVETPYGPWGQVAAFEGTIGIKITAIREEAA
jgi:hypothetical protein